MARRRGRSYDAVVVGSSPNRCRAAALVWLGAVAAYASGCGARVAQDASDAGSGPEAAPYAQECEGAGTPPLDLACTGLYADVARKKIAGGVRSYTPAVELWEDGAQRHRWILLPPGTKIDATDPNEWQFPVGTRVWKELSEGGTRIETRLLQKVQAGYWVRATYEWNADESAATATAGHDVAWDGGTHHIPTGDECDKCHRGRPERVLGFEQALLGLQGAAGLTLAQLVAEGLLSPAPARTQLTVGDDGTGAAAAPLTWLHANCGVSCHNGNSDSTAYATGQRLRLDATLLDGQPSSSFDAINTTVNVPVQTPAWSGNVRIAPGDPGSSLLAKLILNRQQVNPQFGQMPLIDTNLVDERGTQTVVGWIAKMEK